MSAEQEILQQRAALAEAVNRHDLEAVTSFIHLSYVCRTKMGATSDYQQMLRVLKQMLARSSDYQEAIAIQNVAVSGHFARLLVWRKGVKTGWLGFKHRWTKRAVETWWKVDGRWQLVEEQELTGDDVDTTTVMMWAMMGALAAEAGRKQCSHDS